MNKDKCLEQLIEWEIDSFSLGSMLSGFHSDIFYDTEKEELYKTGLLSQNSWMEFDDMIYLCQIREKNFCDTDLVDNIDDITVQEMNEILETVYNDAEALNPLEDWLDSIEDWINRQDEYPDDSEWRYMRPIYPY